MKELKKIFILMLVPCVTTACDSDNGNGNDIIWDIAPITFQITITDTQGHELLDSTRQDNLISDITVTYDGKTYNPVSDREYYEKLHGNVRTRYYMPDFRGLILHQAYYERDKLPQGTFLLEFGEFGGDDNANREITLNLPDGHHAQLAYKNHLRWLSNGNPDISRQFFFDGQELTDDMGKCGIFRLQYTKGQGLTYIK